MSIYDPPSDPYGDEKRCRICDELLEYNSLVREWECVRDHDDEQSVQPSACTCYEIKHYDDPCPVHGVELPATRRR